MLGAGGGHHAVGSEKTGIDGDKPEVVELGRGAVGLVTALGEVFLFLDGECIALLALFVGLCVEDALLSLEGVNYIGDCWGEGGVSFGLAVRRAMSWFRWLEDMSRLFCGEVGEIGVGCRRLVMFLVV